MALHLHRLDDAALEAASSRGLLRRARADLKAGAARLIRQDDDEAHIELAGAQVILRAGGLAAARCTCPAAGICRHILSAILLLRGEGEWEGAGDRSAGVLKESPTEPAHEPDPVAEILAFSLQDLRKAFGNVQLLRAAEGLPAPDAVVITRAGAACVVQMERSPEVRYVAGFGIEGMLVKASKLVARRLCAKALLAVRRAHQLSVTGPIAASARAASGSGVEAVLEGAQALMIEWARSGLAAAPEVLEERLFDAAVRARAAGLFRLSTELRRLSQDVRRRRSRSPDWEPGASLSAASRSFALIEALRRAPNNTRLRGRARDKFERLDSQLRLIGCGYEIWKTPAGARGVTGHFYEPAARRWLSASVARGPGQDVSFPLERAAQRERVWGATLEQLSLSGVQLTNAAISPLGRLSVGPGTQADVRPLKLRSQDIITWHASFTDWSVLDLFVRTVFGPGLGAVRLGAEVAALLPSRTGKPAFDEIAQELVLPVYDRRGCALMLRLPNQPHLESRLLTLLEILARKSPEVFFVSAVFSGERLTWRPYAVLFDRRGAPRPLDAPRKINPSQSLAQQLTHALAQLNEPPPAPPAQPVTQRLLAAAFDALLGLCELGGRMQDPPLLEKLGTLAQRLEQIGIAPGARLLDAVARAPEPERPQALLKAAHALQCLMALLRLPVT